MKPLLPYPFMYLAAVGFGCSVIVHVLSWLSLTLPKPLMFLHLGVFVVWLPTIIVLGRLTRDYKQKDYWMAAFRGAPRWASKTVRALGVYALVHFFVYMFFLEGRLGVPEQVEQFRIFSTFWMVFYGIGWAVLYSATHAVDNDRKCLQGHVVSPGARFCEVCGSPVDSSRTQPE